MSISAIITSAIYCILLLGANIQRFWFSPVIHRCLMVLMVIYAVLSRIRLWHNLRVFGANFLGPNLYLCYSNCFLHLCRVSSTTITMRHTHHYHEPRFTITQVRSLGMPFGGCKESGTGMEGTRYTTFNKRSSHWNLNRIPNFVCMSCMYIVHCTETRSWCVFVFLFCVHVCLPGCLTILVYVY